MGVSGAWATKSQVGYTGAAKLGDGYHPIHGVRDQGRGRQIGAKTTLLPLGPPADVIASDYLDAGDLAWLCEDTYDASEEGQTSEHYRYLDDRPNWGEETPEFRGATRSPQMGEWTSWGVYNDLDPVDGFPLSGPTGGSMVALDIDHGEAMERQHAIAVPTMPVTGGWLTKARGAVAQPESQDPHAEGFVFTINTAEVQGPGKQSLNNDRAVGRGTDVRRTPILSRVAGMATKDYAKSLRTGGGPGTPDMYPYQQTAGYRRPFITRAAALPPDEDHQFNSMEGRVPIRRVIPADPYQGDLEDSGDVDAAGDWY